MRPAMMLLLRALVILGSVLAVISCGSSVTEPQSVTDPFVLTRSVDSTCPSTLSFQLGQLSGQTVPDAGGTLVISGTGTCL